MTPTSTPPAPADRTSYVGSPDAIEPPLFASPTALATLLRAARRRWLVIAIGATVAVAAVIASAIVRGRTFTSVASFVTQNAPPAGLRGIAAQFGMQGLGESAQGPEFYVELLRTDAILGAVVDSASVVRRPGAVPAVTLAELFEVETTDPTVRRAVTIERLRRQVGVSASRPTGIVRVAVQTPDAEASRVLAERLVAEVHRFNQQSRRFRARAEREFTERRVQAARTDLRSAEARLANYQMSNRSFDRSPTLQLEATRLEREVTERQAVLARLLDNFEQARIDEVRDTPVITPIEQPTRATRPDPRGLSRKLPLAAFLGALLGFAVGLLLDWRRGARHAARP